ncbi:MAG: DNA translocase FtsK 4TM domain-containing protein [Lachnospiraceae bacterium]|nr:DNA translocase FtsK 4TM domain-containing protein [Lachnospiraceae bacterium]
MSTSSRKRTTTKRKTSSSKRGRQSKKTEDFSSFHTEVILWIIVAFAALLMLGNFGFCGKFGKVFSSVFFGTFGFIQYIVPIAILLLAGLLIANHFSTLAVKKTLLVIVFLCLCAAISQMVVDFECVSAFDAAGYSFTHHTGGGAIGGGICIFLRRFFGKAGAILIILIGSMISLMLIFEKSVLNILKQFGDYTAKTSKEQRIRWEDKRQQREIEREEERQQRELGREEERQRQKELEIYSNNKKKTEKTKHKSDRESKKVKPQTQKNSFYDFVLEEEEEETNSTKKKKQPIDLGEKFGIDTTFEGGKADSFIEEDFVMPSSTGFSDSLKELTKRANKDQWESDYTEFKMPESEIPSAEMPELEMLEAGQKEKAGIHNETEQTKDQTNSVKDQITAKPKKVNMDEQIAQKVQKDISMQASKTEEKTYVFPPISLLTKGEKGTLEKQQKTLRQTAMKLQQTLANFGVNVTITNVSCGPSVTRYEIQPEQGVKVSKIVSLSDDIKLNLAAADIRMEAPIPGKAAIGIEVPNKHNEIVRLRDLIDNDQFKNFSSNLAFAVGKDISGKIMISDIAKMPHLLIAGATGSGKSVCINTLIMSILYKAKPSEVKFIMIDPKVVELNNYNGIPHLLIPVVTDPQKAAGALNWAVAEMTDRYQKFADYKVRNLKGYNKKVEEILAPGEVGEEELKKLPQIIIIVDELSDLMMVAPGEVENAIVRLSQLARAAGIHLVIATQRPSVNVITGLIKANVPSRIAFSVSSGVDSRTIIDMNGAEKLLGNGDMLFHPQGLQKPIRVQGAFISDQEVGEVVEFLKEQGEEPDETISEKVEQSIESTIHNTSSQTEKDEYFAEAARFLMSKEKASIGMIQRMFKVGFNRASRIMEQLADAGIVGPEEGTKPRKILMTEEQLEEYLEEYL